MHKAYLIAQSSNSSHQLASGCATSISLRFSRGIQVSVLNVDRSFVSLPVCNCIDYVSSMANMHYLVS